MNPETFIHIVKGFRKSYIPRASLRFTVRAISTGAKYCGTIYSEIVDVPNSAIIIGLNTLSFLARMLEVALDLVLRLHRIGNQA